MFWTISGSLRLSQNFVKNWKFSWPWSLAKFQILTTFWTLPFLTCEWIASVKNGILKFFLVVFNHFCKYEVQSKFCQKLKISMIAVLSEISDFDHFFNIVISYLWVNCNRQNGILKCFFVDLNYLWKFEIESKFCQKLKIFMTAVLGEFSDFDNFLNFVISDLWVNCNCQNGFLKCSYVYLKDLWKFEVESKFC